MLIKQEEQQRNIREKYGRYLGQRWARTKAESIELLRLRRYHLFEMDLDSRYSCSGGYTYTCLARLTGVLLEHVGDLGLLLFDVGEAVEFFAVDEADEELDGIALDGFIAGALEAFEEMWPTSRPSRKPRPGELIDDEV